MNLLNDFQFFDKRNHHTLLFFFYFLFILKIKIFNNKNIYLLIFQIRNFIFF
jgi:hypothetical protein